MTTRPDAGSTTTGGDHVSVVVAHHGTILLTATPQVCAELAWCVPGAHLEPGESITAGAHRVMARLWPGGPQLDWADLGSTPLVLPDGREVDSGVVLGYVEDRAPVGEDLPALLWRSPLGETPACPGIDDVVAFARLHHSGASALFEVAISDLTQQLENDHRTDLAVVPPCNAEWRLRQREAAGRRRHLLTVDLNSCRRAMPNTQ